MKTDKKTKIKMTKNDKRKLIVADNSGFCFGVKQAVEKAEDTLDRSSGLVFSCGHLIHNSNVIQRLQDKGLKTIEDISEVEPSSTLIVRSHGEKKEFFNKAEQKKINIVDCTCPYVKRIQNYAQEAYNSGKQVVIIGDKTHPEVKGINGWCDNSAVIINSPEETKEIDKKAQGKNLFVLSQTTLEKETFDKIIDALKKETTNADIAIEVKNTICNATTLRQNSCKKLASEVDAMIIVGDAMSSNSKRLFEIAKNECENTFFIENKSNLPLKALENCNTIGVAAGASTPECIIKEVLGIMSEGERNLMNDFMDEIEKSLRLPRNGEVVTGEVIQVSDKDVIVNLGCKKDGIIPRDEVNLEEGQTLTEAFKEGDEVQTKVIKNDDGDGNILLSKKRVIISEHWEDINKAHEDQEIIEVVVTKEVNGGVIASFKELLGFIPMSQLSDRYVEKADEFIGKTLPVRVTRLEQRRNKVVFSHKAVLNEERQKKLEEIWETLNEGDIIEGTVMRFTDYGAFVDIGGIDGLLHISEISWGKLKHPKEVLSLGEKIKVKVLSMNPEKEKISLGYKQNQPEPWSVIDEKYKEGQDISGKAVQIKDYGVFVELEPGLDGLVHISEIAHKRVNNINEEIKLGQDITAKILEIDKDRKRISLSIKDTVPPPTEEEKAAMEAESQEEEPLEEGSKEAESQEEESLAEKIKEKAEEVLDAVPEFHEEQDKILGATDLPKEVGQEEDALQVADKVAEKVDEMLDAIPELKEDQDKILGVEDQTDKPEEE